MRKINPLLLLATFVIFFSCSKAVDDAQQKKAEEFRTTVKNSQFIPVAFYSDKPIDYITDDTEIKSETDLWGYVKDHVKDDHNVFGPDTQLSILQNAVKIPTIDSAVILRSYTITPAKDMVIMKFVDYNYNPYDYWLHEFTDSYFILATNWHVGGAKLFSRFEKR